MRDFFRVFAALYATNRIIGLGRTVSAWRALNDAIAVSMEEDDA